MNTCHSCLCFQKKHITPQYDSMIPIRIRFLIKMSFLHAILSFFTIIFYNGLFFALKSGEEHRFNPCQIQLVEISGQGSYLRYTENVSKNHPGGLKGRKVFTKDSHPPRKQRKPRSLFCLLVQAVSKPPHAFYLQPLKKPTSTSWYSNQPLGHSNLANTVACLCKQAGIQGYKTSHSLRATVASCLYQAGVDKQLVMERTMCRLTTL